MDRLKHAWAGMTTSVAAIARAPPGADTAAEVRRALEIALTLGNFGLAF